MGGGGGSQAVHWLAFGVGKHKMGPNCTHCCAPLCNETKRLFPCRHANDVSASLSRPHGPHKTKCLPCNNRRLPTCLLLWLASTKQAQIAAIVGPPCNETKRLFPHRHANDVSSSLSGPHGPHMTKCCPCNNRRLPTCLHLWHASTKAGPNCTHCCPTMG